MSNRIYPVQKNGRFFNNNENKNFKFLWPSILMLLQSVKNRFTKNFDHSSLSYEYKSCNNFYEITWIGQATFLIKIGDVNILTDPVFNDLTFLYKRYLKPGISLVDLPQIDFVLISHNHRDHMEESTLYYLKKNNPRLKILVPMGDKNWFDKRGIKDSYQYMWWDRAVFPDSEVEFTFLPAYHWSQRGLFDYNKSLWGSWMISHNGLNIYFGGDSAYADHFKSISNEFSNIKVACLSIGPCEPRKWMKYSHMNSEEAGQAFIDLNAYRFIPMHWGTYYFGVEDVMSPIERLKAWWECNQHLLIEKKLDLIKCGQVLDLKDCL